MEHHESIHLKFPGEDVTGTFCRVCYSARKRKWDAAQERTKAKIIASAERLKSTERNMQKRKKGKKDKKGKK
jgi:hypothetical protein